MVVEMSNYQLFLKNFINHNVCNNNIVIHFCEEKNNNSSSSDSPALGHRKGVGTWPFKGLDGGGAGGDL